MIHRYGVCGVLLFAAMCLGLSGCFSSGNTRLDNKAAVDQVQKGKTKEEIQSLIGDPTSITSMSDGKELWVYMRAKARANAASFVPIVGLLAGGAHGESQMLTVTFSTNNIVEAISKTNTTSDVHY